MSDPVEFPFGLCPSLTPGATIARAGEAGWRLQIPSGGDRYHNAQLDHYHGLARANFPLRASFRLRLSARIGAPAHFGTWGFGVWNDPFNMERLTPRRERRTPFRLPALRLPAPPQAAWFFFASPPNYLSLRDDLPAQGGLAGVFRSPLAPAGLWALAAPILPLLALPPAARRLRRLARTVIREDTAALSLNPADWHTYSLDCRPEGVRLAVDGAPVLETEVAPRGRLGVVIWIDNQYMAFPPDARLRYGLLANPAPAWLEVTQIELEEGDTPSAAFAGQ